MSSELPSKIPPEDTDLVAQRELTRILRLHNAVAVATRKPLFAPLAIAFLAACVFVIPTALLGELFFGKYDPINPDARGGIYLLAMILGAVTGFMATRLLAMSRARLRIDAAIQELNSAVKEVGTRYPMVAEFAGGESRLNELDSVTELLQILSNPRSRDRVNVEDSQTTPPSPPKSITLSAAPKSICRSSDEITERGHSTMATETFDGGWHL